MIPSLDSSRPLTTDTGLARIGCRLCRDAVELDDAEPVGRAQIAAFMAAHRHFAGLSVALTIRLDRQPATPDHLVDATQSA